MIDDTSNPESHIPEKVKVKVLIVDDSRLVRVNLKTALFTRRDEILVMGEAENGQEAILMVEKYRPHVVLMDIGMPIMDGIRATQHIHQQFPEVNVMMLTSHDSENDILDAFRSGASSYCLKETAPELLGDIILSTAQGSAWIDPKIAKVVLRSLNQFPMPPATPSLETNPDSEVEIFNPLTEREAEILTLITPGLNNGEIAERLVISLNTVKTHLKNIFQKLGVEDRTAAVLKALKGKLV
ncbi:MAG: response regulator transcription factor [Cyanobacteria bacterium]|nr:response regulator transcription factor [Cyanobacteriota bacterium]